jgi:16S rRNA G1207 methylase RsmC
MSGRRVRINLFAHPQATVEDAATGAVLARFTAGRTSLARLLQQARAWVAAEGHVLVVGDIDADPPGRPRCPADLAIALL